MWAQVSKAWIAFDDLNYNCNGIIGISSSFGDYPMLLQQAQVSLLYLNLVAAVVQKVVIVLIQQVAELIDVVCAYISDGVLWEKVISGKVLIGLEMMKLSLYSRVKGGKVDFIRLIFGNFSKWDCEYI
jgi:hypothetical protein